ncbi:MAG: hypothetical protein V4773_03295 [Verrucomicrobiota bacterium]
MRRSFLFLSLVGLMLGATVSRAVIVSGGDGTQNTGTPTGGAAGSPVDHVGIVNNGSGVFLGTYGGSHWVLTASHIGAGNFTLSGTTYSLIGGSSVQVRNGDNSLTDLTLFRISTAPALASLTLSTSTPTVGSQVTMVGNGLNRSSGPTEWDINGSAWSQIPYGPPAGDAFGYTTTPGNTMRWGTDNIAGTTINGNNSYNIGTGNTRMFYTSFDGYLDAEFNVLTGQAQGSVGDSGGAVFYKNGSTWELAGIMGVIYTYNGQPSNGVVFGNLTGIADISAYRGAILSAIPEPADVALWCAAGVSVLALWRRRRAR